MKEADKLVVFDTETTGLDFEEDEIIQLSIINADGDVLFNEYIKPEHKTEWSSAQKVHGISPEMLKDKCNYTTYVDEVRNIFNKAEVIVAYNNAYDVEMLRKWGIDLDNKVQEDVMKDFALYYGEYVPEYSEFKWQKLTKCAEYFGYEFKAHDSLEDVRATLFCYRKLEKLKESGEYMDRVKENIERIWGIKGKEEVSPKKKAGMMKGGG